jgi:hypothetical protein
VNENAVRKLAKESNTSEEFTSKLKVHKIEHYAKPGDCCVSFSVNTSTRPQSARFAEDRFGKTSYIACFNDDEEARKDHKI